MKWLIALVLMAGCSSRRAAPSGSGSAEAARVEPAASLDARRPEPIEHRATCGAVTAIWRGHREQGQDLYEDLAFSLPGASEPIRFPHGEMYPPYWSFNIFAPDCRHVLLLTVYTGPYHVVRTDHLRAYLGGAPPDHVLSGRPGESGTVSDGAWVSSREIRYQWGCCDPPVELRFTIGER
jgi:hypothetical protein